MKRLALIIAAACIAWTGSAQSLDPSMLKTSEERQGFNWDLDSDKSAGKRFSIEAVFGLNGYNWSPITYEEGDAVIRQTVERIRPDLSAAQLNNTLLDMTYTVMWTFRNASGRQQFAPRLLRLRYQPVETLPVDVSLGVGRSVALFYAKSQLQATGSTIGVNQTNMMAIAFTDHYFHLREIYQDWWGSEQPRVPMAWAPLLVEIGAGYAPTHRIKFTGAVAVVPNAQKAAQDWQFGAWEQGIANSITEITDVKATTQFALGCQLRLGSITCGFERRMLSFLGDTREYILAGASNSTTPAYTCMSIGYRL